MPAYVQHVSQDNAGGGATSPTTLTLNGTKAGNLICVMTYHQGNTSCTDNLPSDGANTYHACPASSFIDLVNVISGKTSYASAIAGGNVTITCSWTGTDFYNAFFAFELSGCNRYDTGAIGNQQADPTSISAGPFTTNFASEIIVAYAWKDATGYSAGYTGIEFTSPGVIALEYQVLSSTGSQNPSVPLTGSSYYADMLAAAFYNSLPNPITIVEAGAVTAAPGSGW
jgi:hypothetical protein